MNIQNINLWKPSKKAYRIYYLIFIFYTLLTPFALVFWDDTNDGRKETLLIYWLFSLFPLLVLPDMYYELAAPKNGLTTKDVLERWSKNFKSLFGKLLDYLIVVFLSAVVRSFNALLIMSIMMVSTLYIFLIPDGLAGLIARYLVEYSHRTGLNDFTVIYAIFSTAIVSMVMLVISIIKVFIDTLADDGIDPFQNEKEGGEK